MSIQYALSPSSSMIERVGHWVYLPREERRKEVGQFFLKHAVLGVLSLGIYFIYLYKLWQAYQRALGSYFYDVMTAADTKKAHELIDDKVALCYADRQKYSLVIEGIKAGIDDDHLQKLILTEDIKGVDEEEKTSLMCAIESGYSYSTIALLVKRGVELDRKDIHGQTALSILIRGWSFNKNLKGPALLLPQKAETKDQMAMFLMHHGALPSNFDWDQKSALLVAVKRDLTRTSLALIGQGYSIDVCDEENLKQPLLFFPILYGNYEVFKTLIERGVNVKAEDETGRTALMAAFCGMSFDKRFVQDLLKKEPKLLERPDMTGNFPIHYAAKINRREPLQLLIEDGKQLWQIGISRNDRKTPAMLAGELGNKVAMDYLIENGANKSQAEECYQRFLSKQSLSASVSSIRS